MKHETIGQRIRALRRSKKLTQVQLAKIAGVSSPAVTEWEKDGYLPKAASLEAIANEFGVTTEYILTGKGIATNNATNVTPISPKVSISAIMGSGRCIHQYLKLLICHRLRSGCPYLKNVKIVFI